MREAGRISAWRHRCSQWANRLVARLTTTRHPWLWLAAMVVMGWTTLAVLWPMLEDWSTYGFHDWDVMTSYRYITVLSLKQYGEGPWWNPWMS